MAKKNKPAAKPAESVPNEPVEVAGDENALLEEGKFIAVDIGSNGTYEIHSIEGTKYNGRDRHVHLGGLTYEHVGEHRGVWAYRHLG